MEKTEKMGTHTPGSGAPETLDRLKTLVREHRVCWEVWPERLAVRDRGSLHVGFDLVLNGAHAHDEDRPSPGCERCKLIFKHLREIAEWIVPKAKRPLPVRRSDLRPCGSLRSGARQSAGCLAHR